MNARKQWLIRLALSLVFGMIVMGVPLYLILGGANARDFTYDRQITRNRLKNVAQSLQNYKAQHGNYPKNLEQANLWPRDSWGHPLIYSLRAGGPLIESLGRDGKRGGRGMDADLSNRNLYPPEGRVSFWQRLFDPLAQGVIIASGICGLIGAVLAYRRFTQTNFRAAQLDCSGDFVGLIFGARCFRRGIYHRHARSFGPLNHETLLAHARRFVAVLRRFICSQQSLD